MQVTKFKINENNQKSILNFLAINYPNYKILSENQYDFLINGQRYNSDVDPVSKRGKTVRLELEGEGLTLELPIEYLNKPAVSVIPVYLNQTDSINIECIFESAKKEKTSYRQPEKVVSFQNFEIRDGRVIRRENSGLVGNENIIIIKA